MRGVDHRYIIHPAINTSRNHSPPPAVRNHRPPSPPDGQSAHSRTIRPRSSHDPSDWGRADAAQAAPDMNIQFPAQRPRSPLTRPPFCWSRVKGQFQSPNHIFSSFLWAISLALAPSAPGRVSSPARRVCVRVSLKCNLPSDFTDQ